MRKSENLELHNRTVFFKTGMNLKDLNFFLENCEFLVSNVFLQKKCKLRPIAADMFQSILNFFCWCDILLRTQWLKFS